METMFLAGRRSLPPVPPRAADSAEGVTVPSDVAVGGVAGEGITLGRVAGDGGAVPAPRVLVAERSDSGQDLVARLRAAAPDFAAAGGADSALVREAVPPARHRRARCRIVLRFADGSESDLVFLGPVGRPGTSAADGFGQEIQDWLSRGGPHDPAWVVSDDEAPGGFAIDVPAWLVRP